MPLSKKLREENTETKALKKAGFEHFIPLLDKEKEIELFKTVEEYALKKAKNGRTPKPNLFRKYKLKVSIIPSSKLKVVCGLDQEKIKLTPFGKHLKNLYKTLRRNNIEGYLFLTAGGAKETLGVRSPKKSKLSFGKNPTMKDYCPKFGRPKLDGDIIFFTNDPSMDEEKIVNLMTEEELRNPLKLKIIVSESRPFARVDIGSVYNQNVEQNYRWSKYWKSFGHITLPEFKAKYSSSVTFIQSLMGREDASVQILPVPVDTPAGFIGAHLDFFPQYHLYKEVPYLVNHKSKNLKPTAINWPEIMFPVENSPQESLAHFIFLLKSASKGGEIPLLRSKKKDDFFVTLTKLSQSRTKKIHAFSLETSLFFANTIVHKIAANPNSIIPTGHAMLQWTEKLLKITIGILNGNPYLGLIYLLAAGENPTDTPIYGTGIIDPKGFFPELYFFLHEKNRLQRLIDLMAKTEAGPTMKGWPAFLGFLYQETGKDIKHLARLLNPNFCSMEVYPTLVEDFIKKDLPLE